MKTKVIFRKFRDGELLALFPDENHGAYDANGNPLCVSYMHFGQHGAANYAHCVSITRPAKPDEYRDLARELTQIGYDLTIRQRK